MKKKEKIRRIKFPPKVVIIYFGEKARFDWKKNHGHNKLANFWLDIINKINCKTLVVMSYTSSGFGSRKI